MSSSSGTNFPEADSASASAGSMPRRIIMGLAPATMALNASLYMACVSTAAVVVPSPATVLVWRQAS